jgi:putative ABC transport system substrate-binding protein
MAKRKTPSLSADLIARKSKATPANGNGQTALPRGTKGTVAVTVRLDPERYRPWYVALVVLLMSGGLLAGGVSAAERARPIRIFELSTGWGPGRTAAGLRDGLLALGYRERKDFIFGVRFTRGDLIALPAAARELVVQYEADILFTFGVDATKAAQGVTTQIPIVFAGVGDPVGMELIESYARPGGNITGVTDLDIKLAPKRLQMFQEIIPDLKRVLYLYDANHAYSVAAAKVYRDAARRLGIQLVEKAVRTEEEARGSMAQILHQGGADGVVAPRCCALNIPGVVREASSLRAIPTLFEAEHWVDLGGLASYGPDFYDTARQAARLVDKIIKGTDPAVIPVEVNPKIKFVINLKTAKALGLTIAPEMLYQADRIIR